MENKVIAKEYVDKNYVEKSILKKAMREGMMQAKVFEEKAGADIMAKYILVAMGELDKKALDLYEANNRINDLLDIVKQKDEAIKILLTAFEKEKETSHYIQSQLDIANAKLIEEKEMNAVQRKMLNDAFDRGWIHKDKVRERIRELKIIRDENADEIKRNMRFYSIYDSYNLQINELHDLLLEDK